MRRSADAPRRPISRSPPARCKPPCRRACSSTAGFVSQAQCGRLRLIFSTLYSGTADNTEIRALALEANAVYIAGSTSSATLPVTAGALQSKFAGNTDGFAAKLNAQGTALLYATYLGGRERGAGERAGAGCGGQSVSGRRHHVRRFSGHARHSADHHSQQRRGVARQAERRAARRWCTRPLLGGPTMRAPMRWRWIATVRPLIAGSTASSGFPHYRGRISSAPAGAGFHAFAARYDPAGARVFSTLLGGSFAEDARSLAIMADGSAAIGGSTRSADFPLTADAYQRTLTGNNCVTINSIIPPPVATTPCLMDSSRCCTSRAAAWCTRRCWAARATIRSRRWAGTGRRDPPDRRHGLQRLRHYAGNAWAVARGRRRARSSARRPIRRVSPARTPSC